MTPFASSPYDAPWANEAPTNMYYTRYTTTVEPRRLYAWAVLRDHKTRRPAGLWGPVPWRGSHYVTYSGRTDTSVIAVHWPEWKRRGVTLSTDRIIIAPAPTLRDPHAVFNINPVVIIQSGITLRMDVRLSDIDRALWPELVFGL